jgi:hypothetical protein
LGEPGVLPLPDESGRRETGVASVAVDRFSVADSGGVLDGGEVAVGKREGAGWYASMSSRKGWEK